MRPSSPGPRRGVRAGRRARRGRCRAHRAGLDRRSLLRLRSPRPPGRDVHRQPQPRAVQRHQAVPRRRASRSAWRPASPRSATRSSRRPAAGRAAAGHDHARRRARRVRRPPARPGPGRGPSAQGRHRRRQRHGRATPPRPSSTRSAASRSRSCRCTSSSTAPSPTTRPTRSSRRTSATSRPAWSPEGADVGLAFDGDADRCFVVDERGRAVLAVHPDRADRRARAAPRSRARR